MTEYNEWQIWNGGECPVPGDTLVQVQFACDSRSFAEGNEPDVAGEFRWDHTSDYRSVDVIAYRTVKVPEKVVLYGKYGEGEWGFEPTLWPSDTHKLTFEIIDGEPCNPVIERIK